MILGGVLCLIGNINFNITNELILKEFTSHNRLSLFDIIKNNSSIVLINILGSLTFGGFTILNLIYNGFMISLLIKIITKINSTYLYNLIPHSIEIISVIISGSIGIKLGIELFKRIFLEQKSTINKKEIILKTIYSFAIVIVAGIIEYFISSNI